MKFFYKTIDRKGNAQTGVVDAVDRETAIQTLQKTNRFITEISEENKLLKSSFSFGFNKISAKDKIIFSQQLAVMVKSGIPLIRALQAIQKQTANEKFGSVINELISDVEGGAKFSNALSKHPKVFSDLYIQIVKSGEKTGNLDRILLKLSKDMEKTYDLNSKIRGAMVYPIFICSILILMVIGVLIFIIPQLASIFEESSAQLPLPTKILLGLSNFTVHYWWILLIIIIISVIGIKFELSTESGKLLFDKSKLKIPIFGKLLEKIYLARFARTLSTLTSAGLPILDTFDTIKDVIGNRVYRDEIIAVRSKIEAGTTIGSALLESSLFPSMVIQMVSVGEQSGNLPYILNNLAQFYEKETENMTKNLSSLIEPALMVIMGVGVGFFALAVIMPIYNLVSVIK
jgi:type IV pilus assembly protein PilC